VTIVENSKTHITTVYQKSQTAHFLHRN